MIGPEPREPATTRPAFHARDSEIRRLFKPSSIAAPFALVAGYVGAFIAIAIAAQLVDHLAITIAASLLAASALKGINNIVHECSHYSFSNSRRFNERVGTLACIALLMDYTSYKKEHGSHHRYLGDYARDQDFQLRRTLGHDQPFRWSRTLGQLASLSFLWFYLPRPRLRNPEHATGVAGYVLLLAGLAWAGAFHAALVVALAHLVFMPFLRFIIDVIDHGGMYRAEIGELYKSRNFILRNPVVRLLLFPRNDCYHLIHHLYPYLPVAKFGRAHEILLEDPEYRSLSHRATFHLAQRDRSA